MICTTIPCSADQAGSFTINRANWQDAIRRG